MRLLRCEPLGPYLIEVWEDPEIDTADEVVSGCWDETERRIRLRPGLDPAEAQDTILHERLHAISDLYGLDLSHSAIHTLAMGLAQMGQQ